MLECRTGLFNLTTNITSQTCNFSSLYIDFNNLKHIIPVFTDAMAYTS